MHVLRRLIVKSHLRHMTRQGRPVGAGMAIFLDDFISEKILLDGGFDLEELRCLERSVFPHVRKGAVCLDIGANIGNHARFFSRHFPKVYAFEPHPRIFGLLSANAYGQGIVALNYGLSDQAGRFAVDENQENLGASRIAKGKSGAGPEYHVQRLDDVVGAVVTGDIGFVKIDVEGHEAEVIRGAAATLRKHRPIVTFEVLGSTVANGKAEAMEALRALGYQHFYQLRPRAAWKGMQPGLLARLARAFARLSSGAAFEGLVMEPISALSEESFYSVLVASPDPLPAPS
jgi:FkbM family methyltransferase